MKKWLAILGVILLLALAVFLDPTQIMLGFLKGESFYHHRPTSFWRNEVIRNSADAQGALNLPSSESLPVLREMLADDNEQICFFACNAIGIIGPEASSSVPDLLELLEHSDIFHRRNASHALSTTVEKGNTAAIEPLLAAVQEDDVTLNYHCSIALGRIGPDAKKAIPHLETLRTSEKSNLNMLGNPSTGNDTIGYASAWAIDQIQPNR